MKATTKTDLLERIEQNRTAIITYGVKRLGIFGSFARGRQAPDSDVDVLVEFEPNQKTFRNFIGLCFLLEELFERKVKLVTPESLSPYFKASILQETEYVNLNSNFQPPHSAFRNPHSAFKKE